MEKLSYVKIFEGTRSFEVMTQTLPTKGKLVYEYNPLRNYRLTENKYYYKQDYYTEEELKSNFKIEISENQWKQNGIQMQNPPILYEKGQLVDFITDKLKVSLNHPISIIPQYSYDGSVNLILNDGLNEPKLINTRFSATGQNTYEIVDRKGNADTNIYDDSQEQFDIDTALYKTVSKIPKLQFIGVQGGGNLKVGNYHFYFRLSDADGNETDFVAESGLVSVFIGFDSPKSIYQGNKNENSVKQVRFKLSNVDSAYSYVSVYYSRCAAEGNDNSVIEYCKIDKKYIVNNFQIANIVITGFETVENVTVQDINPFYNIVNAAKTQATCQNMLFLGNVHKPEIDYAKLQDLSLRFLPYLKQVPYTLDIDEDYSISSVNKGYYDPEFIYYNTGYWGNELYRFGIVYILPNNELSPVFNIRGRENVGVFKGNDIKNEGQYHYYYLNTNSPGSHTDSKPVKIQIQESTGYILPPEGTSKGDSSSGIGEGIPASNGGAYENAYGVVSFDPTLDTNTIYALDIKVPNDVIDELKGLVKGYFFVRQPRIPTILAQGITIGIDNVSNTPTIPTKGGMLEQIAQTLNDSSYVETENIEGINYISEGFLTRYLYSLDKKHSSFWSKIGKVMISTALIAVAVAGSVVTMGGAAITAAAIGTAIAVGAAGTATAVAGVVDEIIIATNRGETPKKGLQGRKKEIPSGYNRKEKEESRKLNGNFLDRIIIKDQSCNKIRALLCPDYELNQPFYNQVFTGNEHLLQTTVSQGVNILSADKNYFTNSYNHFYIPQYYDVPNKSYYSCKITTVPEDVSIVMLENEKYRSRAGQAEEGWKYLQVGTEYDTPEDIKINSDIIRGSFSPYLAMSNYPDRPAETVNIMIPGYNGANIEEYIQLRIHDKSAYHAISERISLDDMSDYKNSNITINGQSQSSYYNFELYRGDCYICQFTHRLNRNFNDPSAPYNDVIVNENTWKENFDPNKTEKYAEINLGDVNAVQMGMWVTFRVRSSNNLNIRSLDGSNVDESTMTGHPKGFYPYYPMSTEGSYKHSDSMVFNKGFAKTLGDRWNFEVPDVPYIKNWFGTRIIYSDIHVNDGFKNGYRIFQGTHYRDYTREYGEIVKLVPFESSLLCVFEHGIAVIPVNERAVAGEGAGGNVYINTSNVLPENPKIISDMFGSQWAESILKVPGRTGDSPQYVYGVDTVAKKIWRTDGNSLECISDFKVQEFLNNNITLGERELTPIIGIRNVKTVYNAYKRDVMFTFYDNTYGFEEKVWNLCWNELLQKFITFYSWVPSHMENINNIPFSFNRNTSKWVAKLGVSHTENSFADGITLSNVLIGNKKDTVYDEYYYQFDFTYVTNTGKYKTKTYTVHPDSRNKFIGVLSLSNRVLPDSELFYTIDYSLQRDNYLNYKQFTIENIKVEGEKCDSGIRLPQDAMYAGKIVPIQALKFKTGGSEYLEVVYKSQDGTFKDVITPNLNKDENHPKDWYNVYYYKNLYNEEVLLSELYYRNSLGHSYADYETIKDSNIPIKKNYVNNGQLDIQSLELPIFKDITGKRKMLPREEQLNPDKIVTLLNIKANINILDEDNPNKLSDEFYNIKAGFNNGTSLVNIGQYESTIAIAPKRNMEFLSFDFWKHGQAGIMDITDTIYPTYWYGKQHPFEFECIVVNDPSVHKIFQNLELIANKAKPESFHYEIVGESYDFAKDKINMYFRQEAKKALWQYNGADICYDRNFLKVQPKQQAKSADFPYKYYARQDTINDIEDYYSSIEEDYYLTNISEGLDKYSYKHLAGSEIVYYPNRQEFRIWNHAQAITIDDLLDTSTYWDKSKGITVLTKDKYGKVQKNQEQNYIHGYTDPLKTYYSGNRSIIGANCEYLEDRWKIQINPIIVCYKNEYKVNNYVGYRLKEENSTWTSTNRPRLTLRNSPVPKKTLESIKNRNGNVEIPDELINLGYSGADMDTDCWLNDSSIYNSNFGADQNRKELDVKDKFMKVRIRYTGDELVIINYLNTIYRVSYS